MRNIILILFCLIIPKSAFCQVDWFPHGAIWHYEFGAMLGSGITTLEVLDEDTLIGNHVYQKVLSTTRVLDGPLDTFYERFYVYEENRIVYGIDQYVGGALLYDFNAAVGDTIPMFFGGWSPQPFIVDSIGEMEFNGKMLAFQVIRFPDLFNPGEYDKMRVVEGLGSIDSHLFHSYTILQPFDAPTWHFRCYEDENIGLVNLSYNQMDCNYWPGSNSITEDTKAPVILYPNPANDFVLLKDEKRLVDQWMIMDVTGSIQMNGNADASSLIKIDISNLGNGLYIILGVDKTGRTVFNDKITKIGS